LRKHKKLIAILATLAMVLTLLPLGAGVAVASPGYSVLSEPLVSDDTVTGLGTVFGEFPAGALKKDDSVTLSLPDDFIFTKSLNTKDAMTQADWDTAVPEPNKNYITAPKDYGQEKNGLVSDDGKTVYAAVYKLDENEIKVTINHEPDPGQMCYFYLYMGSVYIDSGYSGEIKLTADAPSGSGFGSGTLTVGRATEGTVTVEVNEVNSFSDQEEVTFRIKEDVAGALDKDPESLNLVLPSGFAWVTGSVKDIKKIWGDKVIKDNVPISNLINDDNTLVIKNGKQNLRITPDDDELKFAVDQITSNPICFEVTVTLEVDDETVAKTGDVTARVKGESDVNVSDLIVARYGEYGSKIESTTSPKLTAGLVEQQISDIKITEDVEASLEEGRTIILTLPSNAKWGKTIDEDSDSSVRLEFAGFPGSDGREAKWTVKGKSTDAAELVLEDMEVVLEPGVEGPLEVEVSGTASVTGDKIKVGEVVKSISVKTESATDVRIGMDMQKAGDILITEDIAGAIKEDFDAKLLLDLPDGVKFAKVPKVEVTEGDLDIDEEGVKRQAEWSESDNQLVIPIDGESTKASTIKVSDIIYTVDRTVPEGGITLKVKGTAVNEVNDLNRLVDYFGTCDEINETTTGIRADREVYIEGDLAYTLDDKKIWSQSQTAASVANATCVTPAPGEVTVPGAVVFTIGDTKYKVGDKEETMDVAPYVKNNRTYLPVRYVAYALGVSTSNILWDNANGTATLIKGDRVIQVQIKSKIMLINGAKVTMDVAPEIKDGRTMLPFRWIAQALGASVEWDEATKTVTMKL